MNLGEFRKLTKHLPDYVEIIAREKQSGYCWFIRTIEATILGRRETPSILLSEVNPEHADDDDEAEFFVNPDAKWALAEHVYFENAEQEREYLCGLKEGERVIETGNSMLTSWCGTVTMGSRGMCVKWDNQIEGGQLTTALTHGTRRLKEHTKVSG